MVVQVVVQGGCGVVVIAIVDTSLDVSRWWWMWCASGGEVACGGCGVVVAVVDMSLDVSRWWVMLQEVVVVKVVVVPFVVPGVVVLSSSLRKPTSKHI